jgi:hypothetical protein
MLLTPRHQTHQKSFVVDTMPTALSVAADEDDVPDGPERAKMYNFISNYLSKENGAMKNSPTPMPTCQQQTTSQK